MKELNEFDLETFFKGKVESITTHDETYYCGWVHTITMVDGRVYELIINQIEKTINE